jgi:hypothetical protein
LGDNIHLCLNSISKTKGFIREYQTLFEATFKEIGEDGNEITKKHFSSGRKCLESYISIIDVIENLISTMNFP